jgi:hypothetical protein
MKFKRYKTVLLPLLVLVQLLLITHSNSLTDIVAQDRKPGNTNIFSIPKNIGSLEYIDYDNYEISPSNYLMANSNNFIKIENINASSSFFFEKYNANSSFYVKFTDGTKSDYFIIEQTDVAFGELELNGVLSISNLYSFNKPILSVYTDNLSSSLRWTKQNPEYKASATTSGYTLRKQLFNNLGLNIKLREDWGAPATSDWTSGFPNRVNQIVVHHTATTPNRTNPSQAVLDIYNYHKNLCANNSGSFSLDNPNCDEPEELWQDIGYNYLIDQNGQIYEGRAGGNMVIGAHSPPNFGTIGIAVIGNYQNQIPTNSTLNSLVVLMGRLAKLNNIDLQWQGSVYGHRDRNSTVCPGLQLYLKLPELVNYAKTIKQNPINSDVQILEANKLVQNRQDEFFISPAGYAQIIISKGSISNELKRFLLENVSISKDSYETEESIVISTDIDFAEKIVKETLIIDPRVQIQPSYKYTKASWSNVQPNKSKPSDYDESILWNHELIKTPEAWNYLGGCSVDDSCGGNNNVTVAVLDTGVAYENFDYDTGSSFGLRMLPGGFVMEVPSVQTPNGVFNEGIDRRYLISPELDGVDFISPYDAAQGFLCDVRSLSIYPCSTVELNKINHANDDDGHGTFVATIIAGDTGDTGGNRLVGISHNVKIMPVKVFFPNDTSLLWDQLSTNTEILYSAINHAVANGADVINMSISGGGYDPFLQSAITNAYNNNSVIVAAAGNSNIEASGVFPGAFSNIIVVGSSNPNGNKSSYSNFGQSVDVYAPVGEFGISSQWFECSQYPSDCDDETAYPAGDQFMSFTSSINPGANAGTSFAAPQVAGTVALMKSKNSNISSKVIEEIIRVSSKSSTQNLPVLDVNASLRLTFSNWTQDSPNTSQSINLIEFAGKIYQSQIVNRMNWFRNSADGVNWSSWSQSGGNDGQGLYSVVFNSKLYQAVISGGRNWLRNSPDGVNWSSWEMSGGNNGSGIYFFVFNGRLHQSVISGGLNWFRSTDGNSWSGWSPSGGNDGQGIFTIEFNGMIYQSIISSGLNWHRSTANGTSWSTWSASGGNNGKGVFQHVFNGRLHQVVISGGLNWFRSTDGSSWSSWSASGGNDGQGVYTSEFKGKLYQSIISDRLNWHRITSDGSNWSSWNVSGGNDGNGIFMEATPNVMYQSVLSDGILWTRTTDGSVDGNGQPVWSRSWLGSGGTPLSPKSIKFNNLLLQFVIADRSNWLRTVSI